MAIDRQHKKKKKRDEKRKARRLKTKRIQQWEKVQLYHYNIDEAYHSGKYKLALNLALKSLKCDPTDDFIRHVAIKCAFKLNQQKTVFSILLKAFHQGILTWREDYLMLGELAFGQNDYELAWRVFQGLASRSFQLTKPLTKSQLKTVQRNLRACEALKYNKEVSQKLFSRTSILPIKEKAAKSQGTLQPQSLKMDEQKPGGEEEPTIELHVEPVVTFETNGRKILEAIKDGQKSSISSMDLTLQAYKLSFRTSYDQLLCLPTLRDVQSLWHQEETARKVLKTFRGRAILADEVGLGKTIEACMVLKEYILRGLVRSTLILTPSNLVHQWQEELWHKFGLSFVSSSDSFFRNDPDRLWKSPFVLSSIHTAKSRRHFEAVKSRSYDMVIVDEAHHLKDRTTLNWKLINAIPKSFLLLLTATPVQNKLEELFNLVTLLRPGHLKTLKAFKEEFVTRGNPTDPRNREKLRQLLKEVMLRNTRSVTQLSLPPRFATTVKVPPTKNEETVYQEISNFVADCHAESRDLSKLALQKLLESAGSSHFAALRMLENIAARNQNRIAEHARKIISLCKEIRLGAKTQQVVEILQALSDQKIIFVNYLATLDYLRGALEEQRIPHVVFHGSMSKLQKEAAMEGFRKGCPVLLASGTGGEGHNLQFCHTVINYDLPWNPMEIEQRIGRIHRIGQQKEVQVYNFCAAGSIEDHILEILDRKINMFELVVGEIDMILGRLKGAQEFSEMVYNIWIQNHDKEKRKEAFNALGGRLKRARSAYEKSKELDKKLFQEDFDV